MAYKESSYEWRRDHLLAMMRKQIRIREVTTGKTRPLYDHYEGVIPGNYERVWSSHFFDRDGVMLQIFSRNIHNHMFDKHPEIFNGEWEESMDFI